MNLVTHARRQALVILVFPTFFIGGCSISAGGSGLKSSDPQLTGQRDLNYDHIVFPGERIGPVRMGGLVSDAVRHLGNPSSVSRSTYCGGYNSDEVTYY